MRIFNAKRAIKEDYLLSPHMRLATHCIAGIALFVVRAITAALPNPRAVQSEAQTNPCTDDAPSAKAAEHEGPNTAEEPGMDTATSTLISLRRIFICATQNGRPDVIRHLIKEIRAMKTEMDGTKSMEELFDSAGIAFVEAAKRGGRGVSSQGCRINGRGIGFNRECIN